MSSINLKNIRATLVPTDRWLWGLVGLFLLLGLLSLNEAMLYTPDSIRYLLWAQSLSQFDGFIDLASAEPTRYVVHAPLYSVLLAPFIAILPWDVLAAKILSLVSGMLLLLFTFQWMVRRVGMWGARIGVLILVLHPLVLLFSTHILSDVPFAVVTLLCLVMVGNREEKGLSLETILLALLVSAAIFLREVGLAVMVAIVSFLVWRKDYRAAATVFLIPLAFYAAWLFRNEILVAGFEQPPMQNSKLFFSPMYTPRSAGMLSEFAARVQNNGAFYGESLGQLILFPVQLKGAFPVVSNDDPLMSFVISGLKVLQIPLGLLQIGIVVWGAFLRRNEDRLIPLFLLFLVCYSGLLLLYPIIDNRFLFPLLPIFLGYALVGLSDLWGRFVLRGGGKHSSLWIALLLLLALLPNTVWMANLVANNIRHNTTSREEFETGAVSSLSPEMYRKPFRYVGEWIARHADSSTVIATRWKELTFWLEGQKLIEVDPVMSHLAFESILRDYEAGYLVVLSASSGIRELEFQMLQSRRLRFEPVYRAGGLEVIQVIRNSRKRAADPVLAETILRGNVSLTDEELETRRTFREGALLLERGEYHDAHSRFKHLWDKSGGSGYAALFTGITLAFAGQRDGALAVFEEFKGRSQAGAFLQHAWYHQELLSLLRQAEANPLDASKAQMLRSVAVNYLELGFRYEARKVIDRAIEADSSYFPALTFGTYCALEDGDTIAARANVEAMRNLDPKRPLTLSMEALFPLFDSLRTVSDPKAGVRHLFALGAIFERIGLRDFAVDQFLDVLEQEPENAAAMVELGKLYAAKRRWAPAAKMWNRAKFVSPEAVTVPEEIVARTN